MLLPAGRVFQSRRHWHCRRLLREREREKEKEKERERGVRRRL